ncbi:MAG TPA: prepilin-type N-terminal cleavage/methylation domain-containing protein [Polyangia bacterium]|nr:prepilin-type N-terminal cleavage/methylation domain-containing protein [Polyangia bacterium]
MRRARGFTLMEIMIAMALTSIVTTSVLAIVRTQLSTFEQNDQIMRTQQNARAAMDYIETYVRRACGGVGGGWVGVNVPGVTPKVVSCLQTWDGANVAATAFSTGTVTNTPDALEIIYASGTMTALTGWAYSNPPTSLPASLAVYDITNFQANDYVLVSDNTAAYLFQIDTPAKTGATANGRTPGNLPLKAISGTFAAPTQATPNLKQDCLVFKAASYSFFVAPASTNTLYAGMLMVDPNGVTSANHLDFGGKVQPAVEGAVDFQVAVGADSLNTGNIDIWYGATAGSTLPTTVWGAGVANLKQVRLSLLLQTMNSYAGSQPALTQVEDRTSYPSTSAGSPRYRSAHMIVAPRAWNLAE